MTHSDPSPTAEKDALDISALRAIAEAATQGEWVNEPDTMAGRVWVKSRAWWGRMDMEPLFDVRNEKEYAQRAKDALHVCTFDPPMVLDLLDRLAAVVAIHEPFECSNVRCKPGLHCRTCEDGIAAGDVGTVHWPCPTLRALGITIPPVLGGSDD
jgi:hypothetical protein